MPCGRGEVRSGELGLRVMAPSSVRVVLIVGELGIKDVHKGPAVPPGATSTGLKKGYLNVEFKPSSRLVCKPRMPS